MTAARFDAVIHAPVRLRVCAILSGMEEAEFSFVRAEVDVSESVLSKHVRQLEEAGYVGVRKGIREARQRTWLSLTRAGKSAFGGHVAELTRLAGLVAG